MTELGKLFAVTLDRPDRIPVTVGKNDVQRLYMIGGHPMDDRMCASRIISNQASDRGARAGCRIRAELQTVRSEHFIQIVEDHSRLYANPFFCSINLEDLIHVASEVHDDRLANRLP